VNFPAIYLLHGRGGSPNGSVMQLETELRGCEPEQNYFRPLMPHSDETVTPCHPYSTCAALLCPSALSSSV
jgi:hypothetical protein